MRPRAADVVASLRPALGLSLVCLAAALWATVGVANGMMRFGTSVDPALAGLLRTSFGALGVLVVMTLASDRAGGGRTGSRALLAALLTFGAAGAVFQIALFAAFAHVGVTITVAVTVCAPPLILAAVDARLGPRGQGFALPLALGLAVAGVALVSWGRPGPAAVAGALDLRGAALLAAASIAFACVAAAARVMSRRMHPLRATGFGLAATAAALALVVCPTQGASALATLARLPWSDWAILGYIGLAATGGAYVAFVYGLRLSRSAGAGFAATMIEPALAALFAAALLHERVSAAGALGCALMLIAIAVLARAERRAAPAAPFAAAAPEPSRVRPGSVNTC